MRTRKQLAPVSLWIARVLWATLPVTAGIAAADTLDGWSAGPGITGAVLLWLAWATGLVALLAPRPLGLTALRAIAPAFVALALVVVVGDPADVDAIVAIVAAALAAAGALSPPVAIASVDGASYGDERRYPLKVPPALFLGPLPLAPPVIAAGIAAGPLLLADGRLAAGALALLGLPVAVLAARSLHTLAQRFAVVVPAGITIVEPFMLSDPVLLLRERIASIRGLDTGRRPAESVLDVRLGATGGSLALTLDRETDSLQVRRGRRGVETARVSELWFAALGRDELLSTAAERKIRVG